MMISCFSDTLQISRAKAFLAAGARLTSFFKPENTVELVHSGAGKKKRRVVVRNQRVARKTLFLST